MCLSPSVKWGKAGFEWGQGGQGCVLSIELAQDSWLEPMLLGSTPRALPATEPLRCRSALTLASTVTRRGPFPRLPIGARSGLDQ